MLRNVLFSLVANQLIIRMVTLTLCLKIRQVFCWRGKNRLISLFYLLSSLAKKRKPGQL